MALTKKLKETTHIQEHRTATMWCDEESGLRPAKQLEKSQDYSWPPTWIDRAVEAEGEQEKRVGLFEHEQLDAEQHLLENARAAIGAGVRAGKNVR